MLEVKDLSFQYKKDGRKILDSVSLELKSGELGILLGKNGSGKTTLFKNILGLVKPTGGSIRFAGKDLVHMPRREKARTIAYVPQDIRFGALTVFDSILMGRVASFGMTAGPEDREIVRGIMAEIGLAQFADRNVDELSGGERQKIAIARAMAQEPKAMIFDEPTGNLDIANEQLILTEARRLAREKNIAILSSLHDLNQALTFGDRFFFLKEGMIRFSGGRELFTPEVIEDIFDAKVKIVEIEGQKVILGGQTK